MLEAESLQSALSDLTESDRQDPRIQIASLAVKNFIGMTSTLDLQMENAKALAGLSPAPTAMLSDSTYRMTERKYTLKFDLLSTLFALVRDPTSSKEKASDIMKTHRINNFLEKCRQLIV